MKHCIVDEFATDELVDTVNQSDSKVLIQELNFKYGLKVVAVTQKSDLYKYRPLEFLMTDENGVFTVGKAYTQTMGGVLEYNFYTPYYEKDRGSDSLDKHTIHSVKLSSLMGTLKRNEVIIPSHELFMAVHAKNFDKAHALLSSHHGSHYKPNDLNGNEVHALLKALLGESPNIDGAVLDMKMCKELLDKYNNLDRIKVTKEEDLKRFFNKFYAIGADGMNHLVIGTVEYTDTDKLNIVEPFVRVKDLSNHEHLMSIMTMLKVYMAEKKPDVRFYGNIVPQSSGYVNDLDVINVASSLPSEYDLAWTLIPCSTI